MPPIKPAINVTSFLGYTSKADGYVKNPAVASEILNCVFDDGDLCNYPQIMRKFTLTPFGFSEKTLSLLYHFKTKNYFLVLVGTRLIIYKELSGSTRFSTMTLRTFEGFKLWLDGENSLELGGNLEQVGDWIFLLSQFDRFNPSFDKFLPRMIRLKMDVSRKEEEDVRMIQSPIGIRAPFGVGTQSGSTGDFDPWANVQYDFAITFMTNINGKTKSFSRAGIGADGNLINSDGSDWITQIDFDDIESNGVILGTDAAYNVNMPKLRVYYPPASFDTYSGPSNTFKLGVYAKSASQKEYYFLAYVDLPRALGSEVITIDNIDYELWYTDINIDVPDPATVQNTNKVVPKTGVTGPIIGSHNMPRACRHGVYFKGRMYYCSIADIGFTESDIDERRPYSEYVKNRLEYSMLTPFGEDETGRYANYIEGEKFLGNSNEGFGGLVKFLGQLVVFKKKETHVITDDISIANIRLLFPERLGCISEHAGKAYIVHDDILYWAAHDGIYRYDGVKRPKRISDPIREDLQAIDKNRYKAMRFSVDARYGHLYITFPKTRPADTSVEDWLRTGLEGVHTFIYHINEGGKWTKLIAVEKVTKLLTDREDNVYIVTPNDLKQLGYLDKTYPIAENRIYMWSSTILDLGNLSVFKHWRGFKILVAKFNEYLRMSIIITGKDIIPFSKEINAGDLNNYRDIGKHSKAINLTMRIFPREFAGGEFSNTKGHFRISGFQIDAHGEGRR